MVFPLKRILSLLPGGFLVALSVCAIENDEKDNLVLSADGWLVEFNGPAQMVYRAGRVVASFQSVIAVDVEHFVNGKRFEWWVLSLALQGGKKLFIGRSTNGVEVSIAAAHAATAMRKSVQSIERVGL
jgi:hypothetical protein